VKVAVWGCASLFGIAILAGLVIVGFGRLHQYRMDTDPQYKARQEELGRERAKEAAEAAERRAASARLERERKALEDQAAFVKYLESDAAKQHAFTASKSLVRDRLKSPSTADFPWYDKSFVTHRGKGLFEVNAYVDAQNSFGATLRNRYTCILTTKAKDDWRGLCDLK
jgi:uncharacterized protein involved in type VI secretion and phage assembly